MLENIQQAFQSVWNHKMRSFLTMLGIIIGIASIITIVSSIKGTSEQIKQNLIGSGTNAVVVSLYQNEYPYDSNEMGAPDGVAVITPEVRDELLKLDKVSDVSLFYQRDYNTGVFYLSTGYNGKMLGVDEHYMDLYGYQLCYGRSFVEEDFTQNRKVVLLNTQAVSTLFAGKNPVGKTVEVRGEPFTIIGVVEQGGGFKPVIENLQDYEMYADTSSGSMFITNKGWEIAYRFDQPQSVAVKATGTDDMTAAGKAVPGPGPSAAGRAAAGHEYLYQPAAHLDREHLSACRRHRRDEHHACVRGRANQRDRSEKGHRREKTPDFAPVPHGGCGADLSWRHPRHPGRYRPCRAVGAGHADAHGHQRAGHSGRRAVLHRDRHRLRPASCHQGCQYEPHRRSAPGVIPPAKKHTTSFAVCFFAPSVHMLHRGRNEPWRCQLSLQGCWSCLCSSVLRPDKCSR